MMEYILVMVVVVVIVFVAFRKDGGGVIEQTHNKAAEYFNTAAGAIMGGYYNGEQMVSMEPVAINGGWCDWSVCVNGVRQRECACPRPAFSGKACDDTSSNAQGSSLAITDQGCVGSGEPPQTCYYYRCHLGQPEQKMGVCDCPSPVDAHCLAGDEATVCHY